MSDDNTETTGKIIDLMVALKESLAKHAPAAVPAPAEGRSYSAWLIERHHEGHAEWLLSTLGKVEWTTDANAAVKFDTEAQAHHEIRRRGGPGALDYARPSEHLWCLGPAPVPAPAAMQATAAGPNWEHWGPRMAMALHELVRPDNGSCNQCGGHWLYASDGSWNYDLGEHTPRCVEMFRHPEPSEHRPRQRVKEIFEGTE